MFPYSEKVPWNSAGTPGFPPPKRHPWKIQLPLLAPLLLSSPTPKLLWHAGCSTNPGLQVREAWVQRQLSHGPALELQTRPLTSRGFSLRERAKPQTPAKLGDALSSAKPLPEGVQDAPCDKAGDLGPCHLLQRGNVTRTPSWLSTPRPAGPGHCYLHSAPQAISLIPVSKPPGRAPARATDTEGLAHLFLPGA